MSTIVDCPSCNRKLRVPDELLGKKVKCPTCSEIFDANSHDSPLDTQPAPPPSPPAAAPESTAVMDQPLGNLSLDEKDPTAASSVNPPSPEPAPSPAAQTDEGDYKTCPYCRERIRREATRCRFCGESLGGVEGEDERPWEQAPKRQFRRDSEPHRASLILTLGIISLVSAGICFPIGSVISLPLGITAWILGGGDLKKMKQGTMDPEGMGMTQAGYICGIVGTILGGLFFIGCLGYFGIMIVGIGGGW
jgi:hypothetical protein